jgi:hypothetical protein
MSNQQSNTQPSINHQRPIANHEKVIMLGQATEWFAHKIISGLEFKFAANF